MIKAIQSYLRLIELSIRNRKFKTGKNFRCGRFPSISRKNTIRIGNNFYMGNFCSLSSNLLIGNDVMLGSNVMFVGGDHKIDFVEVPFNKSGRDQLKTTIIKDNVWIGSGSIIVHGITIESGCVIAAGSVLTKNTQKDEIWGGNPAKLIRKRSV